MPSSSRSRGSGRGPDAAQNPKVPKSERQQLAIVMQISSQDVPPAAPITIEERKRTRQQRNERGETPLHTACIKGDVEQVKKLLDQGLDPDQPDFAGWTPLHEACSYGNYPVVELLVRHGVNLNVKGLDDDTPLHDAVTTGNLSMVQLLVEHGAEPFAKNAHGFAPADFTLESHIVGYFQTLKDSNTRASHVGRARDDSKKGNASSEGSKRSSMDGLAQGDAAEAKDDKRSDRDETQMSSVVSSTQDEGPSQGAGGGGKRAADDDDDDEGTKRKKRKEAEDRELMGKPAPVQRSGVGRVLSGSKPPGPASKTGATPLGKGGQAKGKGPAQGKGVAGKVNAQTNTQGKSGGKGASQSGKQDRKSPVASPKQSHDDDEPRSQDAPKVPPLKIVIPGGAGAGGRNDQEGEGGSGGRGGGKGRGGASTLPYVIPCTTDSGQGDTDDDKRAADSKDGQRVLRSHKKGVRTKERKCHFSSYKSSHARGSGQDDHGPSSSSGSSRPESATTSGPSVELHPRKRKIKASRDSHAREAKAEQETSQAIHNVTHSNPYQMYIHIRKQIDRRQKGLFPVKPKPPKDFNKYLMNRCTYTLQGNMNPEPQVELPPGLPPQMAAEFTTQEKERTRLRVQHLVEKEKLVLAVEQEILRVHGRAERAVANQALPFSVCTMLRDKEVYNVLAPEQEEKRNAQRSRCNGRQINSWLQEVDDKWEKIKEGMLRRQHTEAETLHAVQMMGWEWKLKELALCDYKSTPNIDSTHVPQIHVSNFDLPA